MWKSTLLAALCLCLSAPHAYANAVEAEPALTPLELKWLRAGWSVLGYAEEQQLPVDIVVEPEPATDAVPLSMSVADGRCKLVLSMRNNPEAESILTTLPANLHATAIEAVTAHELAHCWRYLNGLWHTLPAGFTEGEGAVNTGSDLAARQQHMQDTRREEGFADLVGLAWTLRNHPQEYALIHAWFERVRADQPVAGSFHDTRTWLQLAAQPNAFPADDSPFEQARHVWSRGLQLR